MRRFRFSELAECPLIFSGPVRRRQASITDERCYAASTLGSNHFIQEGRIAGGFARRLYAGNRASSAAHQESHM
jgi:hypothetical protein